MELIDNITVKLRSIVCELKMWIKSKIRKCRVKDKNGRCLDKLAEAGSILYESTGDSIKMEDGKSPLHGIYLRIPRP